MSQQPEDSPDPSTESFLNSSTRSHAEPVAQISMPSSFTSSVAIPPNSEFDNSFSRMSLEASQAAASSQLHDQPQLPVSSIAVTSSNVGRRTGSRTMLEDVIETCLGTSTPSPDISSATLLSESDSVTWTDTVSPTFPDEHLVTWASSTFQTSLTRVYENTVPTAQPAASSILDSGVDALYRHYLRTDSSYRSSAGSSGEATSPIGVATTHWPVSAVMSPVDVAASSMPRANSSVRMTSTFAPQRGQLVVPSYVSQRQPYQQFLSPPTYAVFPTQRMNSSTRATLPRISNQLSYGDVPSSSRNCPYSRPTASSSHQGVVYRIRRFSVLREAPAMVSPRATMPVAVQSGASTEEMAQLQRLLQEEKNLYQLHRSLAFRQLQWTQMENSARNMGVNYSRAHKVLLGEQIHELQRLIIRQLETVRRLRLNKPLGEAQVTLRSVQRLPEQREMRAEDQEKR